MSNNVSAVARPPNCRRVVRCGFILIELLTLTRHRHVVLALTAGLLALSGAANPCGAAEWQWSVPDGQARAYLWVPPSCERIRGVVVANHNMIEQGILEHPTLRRTLAELGFAQVWVVPTLDMVFDFNKGAGEHFQQVMDALAEVSGYRELRVAPIVPLGHSAHATYPWNLAAWNPGRTLAVVSVKGDAPQTHLTGYGRANVEWGDRHIDGVPGLMVMGEYEWWEDRLTPAFAFVAKHPATPMAFLADAGRGHFDYSDDLVAFLAMFIRKAAEHRLPADAPVDEPIVLKPVDPKAGWRIDRWRKDQPPSAPAAPYEQYTGDPAEAFWCFDAEMAQAMERIYAAARGKQPQLVGFVENGVTYAGEPASPPFRPLEDGVTFRLGTTFLDTVSGAGGNPSKWAGLPNGTPLGHATAPESGPIVISKIVGPVVKLADDTFAVRLDRSVYTENRRNNDMWLLASHPGDGQYKSAVQQAMVRAERNTAGSPQTITFPPIPDQPVGVEAIELEATSDAGLPVFHYVREGPAEVDGHTLRFTSIPPRSRFPIQVTVVAWQWGRAAEPKVQTATAVERTFSIVRP